mgnify:CR=1 FL=1
MPMEYVKLIPEEQDYSRKNLLTAEMEVLNIMKRYQNLKDLRKKELMFKTALRRKVLELNEQIKIIDAALPKTKVRHGEEDRIKMVANSKRRSDLETEIDSIRRKLEFLR